MKKPSIVESTIAERGKVYGDPFQSHTNIGLAWTGLLQQHFGIVLDHPLPPSGVKTYPRSEAMQRRVQQHKERGDFTLPFLLAMECQVTTAVYYGGHIRAGLAQIRHGIIMGAQSIWIRSLCWFTDRMGWTKIVPVAPDSEYKRRHSGRCDKLNCNDFDCLDKGIPAWFRCVTRWDK